MTYQYADGSGNVYRITHDSLSYSPVKPEFSSSGIYDGGEAKNMALTKDQYTEISTAFKAGFDNKAAHIDKRLMGSGSVSAFENGKTVHKFILAMNSKEKEQIETVLKAVLGQGS